MADQSVSFNADVYCIYEDKDHNIWMGTREDGLFLFRFQGEDNYQVTCYLPDKDNPYSISSKSIFSIFARFVWKNMDWHFRWRYQFG